MRRLLLLCVLLPAASIAACGGSKANKMPPPPTAAQRSAAKKAPDAGALAPKGPMVEYTENEFTESDHSRDPFRSFAQLFVQEKSHTHERQLPVVLPQYSLDELKLVAIVRGGDYPRAMLVDPTTKGWVVKKGDFIGRPDTVHTGGTNGADYQLNWRVDRIRDGDIVLTREDPAQPGVPPATRVIPLHPESDHQNGQPRVN